MEALCIVSAVGKESVSTELSVAGAFGSLPILAFWGSFLSRRYPIFVLPLVKLFCNKIGCFQILSHRACHFNDNTTSHLKVGLSGWS